MKAFAWTSAVVGGIACGLLAGLAGIGPARAAVPESTDPIVLSKLDWTGQYVSTEVAAAILRRMGYTVQILQTTQVPMVQAITDGEITASVENWKQQLKKVYDEQVVVGRMVELGPTGLDGAEGWYYPDYVEASCPGLPDWRALKECADIFTTPETAPHGRLLDYPAEWHPDAENWIKAMGLELVSVPSGGEGSTAAELRSATTRNEPLLLQWWEPTWVATQFKLKQVQLDADGAACTAAKTAGIESHKSFDCAAQGIEIVKFAWPGMKDKWPAAYRFLEAYQMKNAWQGPMAMAIETESRTAEEVANEWVAANEAIWKPWVDAATQ